jgi:hypothetical protein
VVLQPWLCGSVDLTANEINIMKKKLDLCCSVLFSRSLHPPGYIQEGQEASYDYLLLGVYHRRSPGVTSINGG